MLSNTILRGDTVTSQKQYDNLIPEPQQNIYEFTRLRQDIIVPNEFDGKEEWKDYLVGVKNQKSCGSCWAFAAVVSLSDRFNIQSIGKLSLDLSPVPIVLCDTHGAINPEPLKNLEESVQLYETVQKLYGCNGNLLSEAWRMLYILGTNTMECMPLNILRFQSPSSCIKLMGPAGDMCSDYRFNYFNNIEYGTPAKFYNAVYVYAVPGTSDDHGSELDIRREIYKYGPVSSAMEVFSDFYDFNPNKGIYISNYQGGRRSGHAIVIDGWGEENGVKFWWVRNSWGEEWGIKGYFKMLRGDNHCKIEENVITGIPNISSAKFTLDILNVPQNIQTKFLLQSNSNVAGGIDQNYGYSRRILSYLRFREELDLKEKEIPLPHYDTFMAGQLGRERFIKHIVKRSSTNKSTRDSTREEYDTTTNKYFFSVIIPVVILIVITIIISLIY